MFHLAGYFLSIANVANTDVPAIVDGVLTISNNHFRLVDNMSLVGAATIALTNIRARLDSPTMRLPGNPYIEPVSLGTLPVDRQKIWDISMQPYPLPTREEIALQATDGTGTTEPYTGLIWLSLGGLGVIPPGRIQWVYLTSVTAAVANTWTTIVTTFQTSLPSGYWCVIGSVHSSATALAHRLYFPGQVWRPGFMSNALETNKAWRWNYNGALGEMGRFVNDNPFQVQVLCNATDASHNVKIGLVQVPGMS
jgi:hypothetical protein